MNDGGALVLEEEIGVGLYAHRRESCNSSTSLMASIESGWLWLPNSRANSS